MKAFEVASAIGYAPVPEFDAGRTSLIKATSNCCDSCWLEKVFVTRLLSENTSDWKVRKKTEIKAKN